MALSFVRRDTLTLVNYVEPIWDPHINNQLFPPLSLSPLSALPHPHHAGRQASGDVDRGGGWHLADAQEEGWPAAGSVDRGGGSRHLTSGEKKGRLRVRRHRLSGGRLVFFTRSWQLLFSSPFLVAAVVVSRSGDMQCGGGGRHLG